MSPRPKLSVVAEEAPQDSNAFTDRLLLDAWNSHQDPDAFAALVQRYAGLVKGVCKRQSRSPEDAEDAFQATFLALSRDATRLRKADCLASWLHQVAYRIASRNRSKLPVTEILRDEPSDPRDSLAIISHRHRLRALDEEIQRLPDTYRCAIVLHYYEGCTYDQAAERLHTTEPVIRGRLQRARKKLHRRLLGRGVTLSLTLPLWSAIQSVEHPLEHVDHETVRRTAESVMNSKFNGKVDPRLKPLLTSETPFMFSTSLISLTCAGTIAIAGFLVSQVGQEPGGPTGSDNVVVQAQDVKEPTATIKTKIQASSQDSAKLEKPKFFNPFNDSEASDEGIDPFRAADSATEDVNPFGSDPFSAADSAADSDPFNGGGEGSVGTATVVTKPINNAESVSPDLNREGVSAMKTVPVATGNAEVHGQIEQALSKKATFDFYELPLADAIDHISRTHELPILIDRVALEEIGLTDESEVNLSAKGVSLHSGLKLLLRDLELTYTIDDEHLQITTVEADESDHQLLKVYWVTETGLQATPESVDVLETMIDPETWSSTGGLSDITILGGPDESASGFAVRTTYQTHRKIESFLGRIEKGTDQQLSGQLGNSPSESGAGSQGGMF